MINRNNKLEIFENFQVDLNLPKYTQGKNVDLVGSIPSSDGTWVVQTGTATTFNPFDTITFNSLVGVPMSGGQTPDWTDIQVQKKESFWSKIWPKNKKIVENRKMTMTIISFFSSLAQSLNDLKTLQDIAIHYEIAITNATKAGQTALVDKLKLRLVSAKSEAQLVTLNLNKFLIEEQVVDFYKKTNKDKNLKLTWIKHFVKNIPTKVLDLKDNLDKQYVFDNYVILHYDPNNDATDLTTEEKVEEIRRQKDPILFGMLKDSRRLYYIADWIDEYCNLTLDVVIETLGEKVNLINNDSVKTYIDRGERIDERIAIERPMAYSASTFPKIIEEVKRKTKKTINSINSIIPKMKRTSSAKEIHNNLKQNKKKK